MRVVYGGSQAGTRNSDGQILREPASIAEVESNQRLSTDKNVRRINGRRIHFRELAVMAFPNKTEANLAFIARVDARTARRWLADDNEPPGDVLGLVLAEIMRCYGRRD